MTLKAKPSFRSKRVYNKSNGLTKICPSCEEEKPVDEFYINVRGSLQSDCKSCAVEASRQRRLADPEKRYEQNRKSHLKRKYGITLEQYNQLLEKQDYCCAVCGKHETQEKKKLVVDHNHITREIRGLLCNYCNHRIVGRHRDGELLRKIADYIEQGTGWLVPEKKRVRKKKRID